MSRRAFFKAVEYDPHRGQEGIHAACERDEVRTIVVACGARFGKTKGAAHEMAYHAILPRAKTKINNRGAFMGWCVAPTHDLASLVFDTVADILTRFLQGHISVNRTDGIIRFTNLGGTESVIMRRTTENAGGKAKLVGHAVDFMVVDEASGIFDESVWESQLRTRLTDRKGKALLISTPRGVGGFFAKLFRLGRTGKDPSVVSIQRPSWTNPYLDKDVLARERDQMDEMRFRQENGAEFISWEGLVFPSLHVEPISILDFEQPIHDADYYGGLDLAMTNDWTVLTILRRPSEDGEPYRAVWVERFRKLPNDVQLARIEVLLRAYNDCPVNVDENGLGKPLVDQMRNLGWPVTGVHSNGQGKSSKIGMVNNARALVERGKILLPTREACLPLHQEFEIYSWNKTPTGRLTAAAPEGMHDDCVSSLLLACHWVNAAGTQGEGNFYGAGQDPGARSEASSTPARPRAAMPEMKIGGIASPEHPSNREDLPSEGSFHTTSRRGIPGFGGNSILRRGW